MATTDLESHPPPLSHPYAPLPDSDTGKSADTVSPAPTRSRSLLVSLALSFVFLFALAGLISRLPYPNPNPGTVVPDRGGVEEGASSKSSGPVEHEFLWGSHLPTWQKTGFHFHPEKNWMNDPSAPMFYKGWYHLFYQYNPDSACWGNITWGHSVSHDLVNWQDLPLAMVRDKWYDIEGAMTGSATFLPDGRLMMLYTGRSNTFVQMQCLAEPADVSDPLLLKWVKYEHNPVLLPPPGIGDQDFRDPTSAW